MTNCIKSMYWKYCECRLVRPLLSGMLSDLMTRVHWSVRSKFSGTGLLCFWYPALPVLRLTWFDKLIPNFNSPKLYRKEKVLIVVHLGLDLPVWFWVGLRTIFFYPFIFLSWYPLRFVHCVNRSLFRPVVSTAFFLQDLCFGAEGALEPDGWWWPLSSCRCEDWRNEILTCIFFQKLPPLN